MSWNIPTKKMRAEIKNRLNELKELEQGSSNNGNGVTDTERV
jgi:hypothetical protein